MCSAGLSEGEDRGSFEIRDYLGINRKSESEKCIDRRKSLEDRI